MASSSPTQIPFQILDVIQGPPNKSVYYRIEAGSCVRYLAAPKPLSGLPDTSGQYLGFDTVPAGDWNIASLVTSTDCKFTIASTENKSLPNATPTWHVSKIDFLELSRLTNDYYDNDNVQLRGHIPSGIFPSPKNLGATQVAAFWNYDPDCEGNHGLSQESHIYSLIQHVSIAPKFLAHLTESHGRVIGYVLETVPGRPASLSDLDLCREVLQKLHNLGIAHGSLTPNAFLIRDDAPVAQMQFFYSSYKTTDRAVLEKEKLSLEKVLQQPPLQQPAFDQDLSDVITAFQERDGYVHPAAFWQVQQEGRISISPEDHRAMIANLAEKDWQWSPESVQADIERLRSNGGTWDSEAQRDTI